MQSVPNFYVIGDIHGQLRKLVNLLQEAGIVNNSHSWVAGNATLLFMGDFIDRGPDGIPVIDLVMRLQSEAASTGGRVESLLGNHEMLILAAYRFGRRSTGLGSNFLSRWKQNGGNRKDLASLTSRHLAWLSNLPAMALVDDYLFVHADAPLYIKYGRSVEEVNDTFSKIMKKSDALVWEELLEDFARRGAFAHSLGGQEFVRRFLEIFGGQRLVHGHTPISIMLNCVPKKVTAPWIYSNDRCINVDGGMFLGGSGFVYQIPSTTLTNSN